MAESRWDSRRVDGQRATLGIPRGETAIAHDQRRLHAHNGSSPASFPRPQRQRRCAIQPGVVRVAALPRVLAKSCSLPRKGLCRSCPPRGSISKGGMGRRSLVQMKSPPGGNVHYLHNVQTPHALRSAVRHNHLRGCDALPDHTRGNADDGATPGFGAEPSSGIPDGDGGESPGTFRKSPPFPICAICG